MSLLVEHVGEIAGRCVDGGRHVVVVVAVGGGRVGRRCTIAVEVKVAAGETGAGGGGRVLCAVGGKRGRAVHGGGRGGRARYDLEREELVLLAGEAAQYAEQVGVVVVLQYVAHLGDVVEREEGDVLVALLRGARVTRGGRVRTLRRIDELQARLANL